MAKASSIAPNRHAVHPFDLKYGTDTGGYLSPQEIATGGPHDALNNGYSAIAPSVFREACRRWRDTLPRLGGHVEAYTFVDVGAGKGRALLLAAEMPFRKVIGVELSKALAYTAKQNIVQRGCRGFLGAKIRVVRQDAAEFTWPHTPLLVYLYNSFACELVEQLVARLSTASAGPGLVDLLYVNPTCAYALNRGGKFETLWADQIDMDEGDRQGDPYGTASDRVSLFRLRTSGRAH